MSWTRSGPPSLFPSLALVLVLSCAVEGQTSIAGRAGDLALAPCGDAGPPGALCGSHEVPEDADRPGSRTLALRVVVLPAVGDTIAEPIFYLPGGPGAPATPAAAGFAGHGLRQRHDLVFVDVRGTAGEHALRCDAEAGDNVLDRLEIFARTEVFEACRDRLARSFDLTEYSTPRMVDDFESVRRALGHERIGLLGTSGGTRTAFVYMRRYPDSVRAAAMMGVAPTAFRNPLHHARSAQDALDGLLELCASRERCSEAYPNLREELDGLVERLRRAPVPVTVSHPSTGEPVEIPFSDTLLGESLRQLMYSAQRGARIPLLIHRAAAGDLRPLAQLAVSRAVAGTISIGLLNSIVCSEDARRIREEEIDGETAGTLLRDTRVRQQLAVCEIWPRAPIDPSYGDDIVTDHPVLMLSGTLDPVTPPSKAEQAARLLPNAVQITVPGAHNVFGPCVNEVVVAFFATGGVEGLADRTCLARIRYPEFVLP